jgi:hypothetical protein
MDGRPESTATALIKTEGMYMGIFDMRSPVNTPGRFGEALENAGGLAGAEGSPVVPHFNELWAEGGREHTLLPWVLLFDGVFRVRIEVLPSGSEPSVRTPQQGAFLGNLGSEGMLLCPSGQVVVAPLLSLGEPSLRPSIVVPRGLYRVRIGSDEQEQIKHEFLDRVEDYPPDDGPDWTLYMRKVEDAPGSSADP